MLEVCDIDGLDPQVGSVSWGLGVQSSVYWMRVEILLKAKGLRE
jgi:hypothetical protein